MAERVKELLSYVKENKKLFYPSLLDNYNRNTLLFESLGEKMLSWSENYIGDNYIETLVNGYCSFVIDVNRNQSKYEIVKHYKYSSYAEVFKKVYGNPEVMNDYHWGVYLTTFAWGHHLKLYNFFNDYFVSELPQNGDLLDLGSGSGIWSTLFSDVLHNWNITGVDISETSVRIANKMSSINSFNKIEFICDDALTYKGDEKYDAVISCFLLEHLETPEELFSNIYSNLKDRGLAFVSGALTAAETDHIYEFKNESELINLAEANGFRVISSYSASSNRHPDNMNFLPRSMVLVLQKKKNDIW